MCGMNGLAADVACWQIGFDCGVVLPAGCAAYGGDSMCGASGSPVAAKNVKAGWSWAWGCVSMSQQMMRVWAMLMMQWCFAEPFSDGQLRPVYSASGEPALPHDQGRLINLNKYARI